MNNGIGVIITTKLARSVANSFDVLPRNIDVLIDNDMNTLKFIVSAATAKRSHAFCLHTNAANDAMVKPQTGNRKPAK